MVTKKNKPTYLCEECGRIFYKFKEAELCEEEDATLLKRGEEEECLKK
jgi:hypothetical protein